MESLPGAERRQVIGGRNEICTRTGHLGLSARPSGILSRRVYWFRHSPADGGDPGEIRTPDRRFRRRFSILLRYGAVTWY